MTAAPHRKRASSVSRARNNRAARHCHPQLSKAHLRTLLGFFDAEGHGRGQLATLRSTHVSPATLPSRAQTSRRCLNRRAPARKRAAPGPRWSCWHAPASTAAPPGARSARRGSGWWSCRRSCAGYAGNRGVKKGTSVGFGCSLCTKACRQDWDAGNTICRRSYWLQAGQMSWNRI